MCFTDLETERLLLKVISPADADFILRHFSNDDVNRYLFDAEPYETLTQAKELIRFYNEPDPRSQNRWIMVKKNTGEKIGTCGFHRWDRSRRSCELGYDLSPDYRRQGYMREALTAIIDFAKTNMNIRRMEAHIAEGNIDSVNASVRQGFVDSNKTYMEVFRGKEYPHHIYTRNFEQPSSAIQSD